MNKDFGSDWTFLTNHSHVLLCLVEDSTMRIRDIAAAVGITQRAVLKIIGDLEGAGYLQRRREGRRNCYEINTGLRLRHPLEADRTLAALIALVSGRKSERT